MVVVGHLVHKYNKILYPVHHGGHPASPSRKGAGVLVCLHAEIQGYRYGHQWSMKRGAPIPGCCVFMAGMFQLRADFKFACCSI